MKKYKWFIVLWSILLISVIACTISKEPTPFPITLTPNSTPTITLTCTVIPPEKITATVNVDIGLNLREDSNENSKSLYILENGDVVEVVGVMENGWSCVEFTSNDGDFYKGYVNSKYISLNSIALTQTPTPEN